MITLRKGSAFSQWKRDENASSYFLVPLADAIDRGKAQSLSVMSAQLDNIADDFAETVATHLTRFGFKAQILTGLHVVLFPVKRDFDDQTDEAIVNRSVDELIGSRHFGNIERLYMPMLGSPETWTKTFSAIFERLTAIGVEVYVYDRKATAPLAELAPEEALAETFPIIEERVTFPDRLDEFPPKPAEGYEIVEDVMDEADYGDDDASG